MKRVLRGAVAIGLALTALAASAQTVPVVDGALWARSTLEERRAFLIGATSMVALEHAYAKKRGTPPSPASDRIARAIGALTLDEIAARVSRWYAANPGKLATPVLGVVW